MATEHAVIVRFQYPFSDLSELQELEDELIDAIDSAGVGEFDGNEVATNTGDARLYMYGIDADRLFEAVKPVLESSSFMRGAIVTKRYGPPDPGVEEVQITIGSKSKPSRAKRKPARTADYAEGEVFAVPLPQDGFGLCLVARKTSGGITLGYFFGPRTKTPKLHALKPQNACLVGWFGDLGIIDGKWVPVGRLPEWQRDNWPMPVFGRTDAFDEEGWKVFYDDDGTLLSEEPVTVQIAKSLPRNTLMGFGAAEVHLGKAISLATSSRRVSKARTRRRRSRTPPTSTSGPRRSRG